MRLLEAGYLTAVHNRSPEATKLFADLGVSVKPTPIELTAGVDVVVTSVFDDTAVSSILDGENGVFAGRPRTVVEMSTISPDLSRQLHGRAKSLGIDYLDAPVSGSTPQAEKGELVVIAGGEASVVERCKPILLAMGKSVQHVGPGGAGSMAKLCINSILAAGVQAVAEALAMGEGAGLDRSRLLDVIGSTAVVSPGQKSKFLNVINDTFPPAFALKTIAKDLQLILEWARSLSVGVPMAAVVHQTARAAVPMHGDEDFSVLIRTARKSR